MADDLKVHQQEIKDLIKEQNAKHFDSKFGPHIAPAVPSRRHSLNHNHVEEAVTRKASYAAGEHDDPTAPNEGAPPARKYSSRLLGQSVFEVKDMVGHSTSVSNDELRRSYSGRVDTKKRARKTSAGAKAATFLQSAAAAGAEDDVRTGNSSVQRVRDLLFSKAFLAVTMLLVLLAMFAKDAAQALGQDVSWAPALSLGILAAFALEVAAHVRDTPPLARETPPSNTH
jgi:hypothetical protein